MIELINVWAVGGIAAAAAPIIVHIAHRRQYVTIDWGAMRFLVDLVTKKRRRLFIDQLLLLATRVAMLLLLALALCRPAVERGGDKDRLERRGAVSAVLLIDDSLSTTAGRAEPAFAQEKKLARAYLDTLRAGDEVSVLTLSRLNAQAAEPVYDLEAAKSAVASLTPACVASDAPALLEAGLAQLARHLNPACELVLVGDGMRDGWRDVDALRWGELRRRLGADAARGDRPPVAGSRARPNVLLLAPTPAREDDGNVAVVDVRMDRAMVPANRPVGIRVVCRHVGAKPPEGAVVRLSVDGRPISERPLVISADGTAEIAFTHSFPAPGSYIVEASIEGARDPLPLDDRRAFSVQVEQGVPVLLVEGERGEGARGSLGLVAIALDPGGAGEDLFAVDRADAADLATKPLEAYRVLVLGDVPALDAQAIGAVERFVAAGGGLLVAPGPRTDIDLANRFWARGGHGFLPCALAEVVTSDPATTPGTLMVGHPAFAAFTARAADAWRAGKVRKHLRLDPVQSRDKAVARLLELDDGDPLIVERGRGLGRVALVTTPLDLQWSELPHQPSFVPLVRGLVSYLGAPILPPRNLRPGDRLTYRPLGSMADLAASVEGPPGTALTLSPGTWEGRAALLSEPLRVPGAYAVRSTARTRPGEAPAQRVTRFACAVPTEESTLEAMSDDDLKPLAGVALRRFRDAAEIAGAFGHADRRAVELWRALVVCALALLFVETWLTRRLARAERVAAGQAALPAEMRDRATAATRDAVGAPS